MTTDQPQARAAQPQARAAAPDQVRPPTPDPALVPPHQPKPTDQRAERSAEWSAGRSIPGAGTPPTGPAAASGSIPALPIPGAGEPPSGPMRSATPPAPPKLSEWERSRRGLTEPTKPTAALTQAAATQTAATQTAAPAQAAAVPATTTAQAAAVPATTTAQAAAVPATTTAQAAAVPATTTAQAAAAKTPPAAATATQTALAAKTTPASEQVVEPTTEAATKAAATKIDEAPQRTKVKKKPLPSTRPPGSPPDPWTAFASQTERAPGRFRRGLRKVGRTLIHEYALVIYGGLLLAVILTWPTLRYPLHTLPQDIYDPARQAWQVAWAGHILLEEPARVWQANAFHPERYSFAYGSSLLGYAPAGFLGDSFHVAILRYNILFVLAHALLFIGAYALIRQLGAGRTAAVVAGVAFAYAPWRLAQEGHLDVVSAGGIPLALAMLARGHGWSMRHGYRPARRHVGWAAAGWAVALWQVSLGFSLGLPFLMFLAGLLLVMSIGIPIRRWRDARAARQNAIADELSVAPLLKPADAPPAVTPADPQKQEPPGTKRAATKPTDPKLPDTKPITTVAPDKTALMPAAEKPGTEKTTSDKTTPAAATQNGHAATTTQPTVPAQPGDAPQPTTATQPGGAPQPTTATTPKTAATTTTALQPATASQPAAAPASAPATALKSGARSAAGALAKIRKWAKTPPPAEPKSTRRTVLGWQLFAADLIGAIILFGVAVLIAAPYLRVSDNSAGTTEIDFFSPPWHSLLIAPAESRIWGAAHEGPREALGWPAEMSLLPGFVLYALALAGLFFSIWKVWQRLVLVLALAVSVILTMGTTFFDGKWTYLPIFGHLPGSFGVRIPGRLMLWVTLVLVVLAAGAMAELVRRAEQSAAQRLPPWPSPWVRLATFVPLMLILAESVNATPHPVVPAQPAAMRSEAGPILVLPTAALGDQTAMLWTVPRFQPLFNGSGGFAATQQSELRQTVASFPDPNSIQYLREAGVTTVLLIRDQVDGTPWERSGDVPVDTMGIRREDLDDNTVLFRLS